MRDCRLPYLLLLLSACSFGFAGCATQKPPVRSGMDLPPAVEQPKPGMGQHGKAEGLVAEQGAERPGSARIPMTQIDFVATRQHVEKRLAFYDESLGRWQALDDQMYGLDVNEDRPAGWHECLMSLEDVVLSYSKENEELRGEKSSGQPSSLDSVWQDIDFLESDCNGIYEKAAELVQTLQEDFGNRAAAEMELAVTNHSLQGRNYETVTAFSNLQAAYPDFSTAEETQYRYALALVRTGKNNEAVSFLKKTFLETAVHARNWPLKRLLADLLLVNDELPEARKQYGELAEYFATFGEGKQWVDEQLAMLAGAESLQKELIFQFRDFLGKYIAFEGRKVPLELKAAVQRIEERAPASLIANRARQILWLAEEQAGAWVGRQLLVVDGLVEEKEFAQALEILEKLLVEDLPADVRRVVQDTLDNVILAENEEKKAQMLLLEQAQAMQWETANKLFGMRQYDEAIVAFQELMGSDYDEKAKDRIGEAVNSAAADMRREAAGLFVKARKTADPDKKMEFMLESLALLRQILTKYATADIIDKVQINIEALEEQIRVVDPGFSGKQGKDAQGSVGYGDKPENEGQSSSPFIE